MTPQIENQEEWILRILNGEADTEELRDFTLWVKHPENRALFEQFKKVWNLVSGPQCSPEQMEAELDRFRLFMRSQHTSGISTHKHNIYKIISVAAACLLPVLLASYWLLNLNMSHVQTESEVLELIVPGKPKAVLTTTEGHKINLDNFSEQKLQIGANTHIKNEGSAIIYTESSVSPEELQYNTLTTPRGGEYRITLSDGTTVHVNAASELRYPIVFASDKREVYLSGEAYFEVKKDSKRPFYVITDAIKVKVYGTTFNVNAPASGCTEIVLETGSVGISGKAEGTEEYKLKPSQLASFTHEGILQAICDVDTRPYTAWKDGIFIFEDMSLDNILNRLALWYDVDIFYSDPEVKNYRFTGYMKRYEDIETILNAIRKIVGVKFSIKQRTIVVEK